MMRLYFLSLSFTGVFSLLLGIFVWLKNRQSNVNVTWALTCICVSGWSLTFLCTMIASDFAAGLFYGKLTNICAALIPVFLAHFCLEITNTQSKKHRYLLWYGYFNCAVIIASAFTEYFLTVRPIFCFNFYSQARPMYNYFVFHFYFFFIYHEIVLWRALQKFSGEKKIQIRTILIGVTAGYLGAILTFLPLYDIMIEPVTAHFIWLYAAIITYGIMRYQVFDINIIIKKTFLYSLWTLSLSIFYGLAIMVVQSLLNQTRSENVVDIIGLCQFLWRWSGVLALGGHLALMALAIKQIQLEINQRFFMLCLAIGLWAVGSSTVTLTNDTSLALTLLKISYSAGVWVPILFLRFIDALIGTRSRAWVERMGFGISVTLLACLWFGNSFIPSTHVIGLFKMSQPGSVYHVFVAYFVTYILMGLYKIVKASLSSTTDKRKLTLIGLAYVLGILAGFEYFLCVYGVLQRPPLDDFLLIPCIALLGYCALRYTILNMSSAIKKALGYSLIAVLISFFYVMIVVLIHAFFRNADLSYRQLMPSLLLILFITLVLRPLESISRQILDKRFFSGTIDQIAEQKQRLQTELERSERLKSVGVLAAGIMHEIKNPLTILKTYAEHLPAKQHDKEFVKKCSETISSETGRIEHIVRQLLDFSKPKEPVLKLEDMSVLVHETLDMLESNLFKQSIELIRDISPDIRVMIDRSQIRQVILNLILNSSEAMSSGGTITVSLLTTYHLQPTTALLSIKDTGPGIPEERIKHIFDPFYTTKESGTGLGLSIVHGIVKAHNARITIHSKPGEGAEVVITFKQVN